VMEAGLGDTLRSDAYARLFEATTGWLPAEGELSAVGDRIWHLERLFNMREGIGREQDVLPRRVMQEEIPSGPLQGERVPFDRLQHLLDAYYRARGCGRQGHPTRSTLERLGLTEYGHLVAQRATD
jgi:aldehyde:ferredoxin oxidoreductase